MQSLLEPQELQKPVLDLTYAFFSPFLMKLTCPQQHRPPPVTALGLSRKSLNLKEGFPPCTKLRIIKCF